MSMIPVDLRLAKMLVLGTIFKCLDPSEPWTAMCWAYVSLDYRCYLVVEAIVHFANGEARREQEVGMSPSDWRYS